MDAEKIKTTRETGDGNITEEAGDNETRHRRHDGEITEQTSHDGEITERTKASGAERSATGRRFVAAGEPALSEMGTSENDDRPCFYLVVCVGFGMRL